MAYTPINWQTGDTITAEKMNKMDNGWGVSSTQLFSETVTTATTPMGSGADLVYSTPITADSITVIFEGVEYEVNKIDLDGLYGYGTMGGQGPDFTVYPFFILSPSETEAPNQIYTETNGTYTVAVNATVVEVGSAFSTAVNSVGMAPFLCQDGVTTEEEISNAMWSEQRMLYFYANGGMYIITLWQADLFNFIPAESGVSAEISDGIFTVTIA